MKNKIEKIIPRKGDFGLISRDLEKNREFHVQLWNQGETQPDTFDHS